VHNGKLDEGVDLIGKPFSLEALASKIREVLEARGGGREQDRTASKGDGPGG